MNLQVGVEGLGFVCFRELIRGFVEVLYGLIGPVPALLGAVVASGLHEGFSWQDD